MKWFKKYAQAEYETVSGSVVNPSVVLAGSEPKFGGNIAISDNTNKPLMDALRNKGVIASDKTYLTIDEAGQITTLPSQFASSSVDIESFVELRFFTGITSFGSNWIRTSGDNYDKLTSVALPPTVSSIGNMALQSRYYLKKIVIPDKSRYGEGVSVLPNRCVRNNYGLRLLVLPSTLTRVEYENFARIGWGGSNNLYPSSIPFQGDTPCAITLICKATIPPTVVAQDNNFFTYSSASGIDYTRVLDLKIYVPDGSVNTYKAATWWAQYAGYILPLSSLPLKFYDFFSDNFYKRPYDAEVEYLIKNSNNAQYIDTKVYGDLDTEIGISFKSNTNSQYQPIFGWRGGTNDNITIYARPNAVSDTRFGNIAIQPSWSSDVKYSLHINKDVFWRDDGTEINVGCSTPFTTSGTMRIGAWNKDQYSQFSGFIYSAYIKRNGGFIRDYIPVRKGTVGYLYDRISGELFGDVSGVGFSVGPDVSV